MSNNKIPFGKQKSGNFGPDRFKVLDSYHLQQHDNKWIEIQKLLFDISDNNNTHGTIRLVYVTKIGDRWKRINRTPVMTKEILVKLSNHIQNW